MFWPSSYPLFFYIVKYIEWYPYTQVLALAYKFRFTSKYLAVVFLLACSYYWFYFNFPLFNFDRRWTRELYGHGGICTRNRLPYICDHSSEGRNAGIYLLEICTGRSHFFFVPLLTCHRDSFPLFHFSFFRILIQLFSYFDFSSKDALFGGVITVLCMLGVLLIYSLMLSDTDEKTYEYGMLRALGMPQRHLIQVGLLNVRIDRRICMEGVVTTHSSNNLFASLYFSTSNSHITSLPVDCQEILLVRCPGLVLGVVGHLFCMHTGTLREI